MASIVKRKNRYSVVYTYKDDDGNQHQKWETVDTNADAKKRNKMEYNRKSHMMNIRNTFHIRSLKEMCILCAFRIR